MRKLFVVFFLLNCISVANADQLITTDKALGKIFPKASSFELSHFVLTDEQVLQIEQSAGVTFAGNHSTEVQMFTVTQDGSVIGYAFEDTVIGKWGTITYLLGLDPAGKVVKVVILEYSEIRGRPIAKNRFLKQYKGKDASDSVQIRRDINGITGATISSRSVTDGIRKILHVFQLYLI